MSVKSVIFSNTFKYGKTEYQKGEEASFPFLEACLLIQAGAAKDKETGFTVPPKMHVEVFPDNCLVMSISND